MLTDLVVGAIRPLPLRGKLRLLNTLIPHEGERSFEAYGCRFRLDLGESEQRRVYLGAYDAATLRAIGRRLPRDGCFVDAHADIGLLTALAASRLGPAGQILAAESRSMSYLRLEGMVRDNHLNQVILHHGSLGGRDDHPARTFDSMARDHGIHHVDLLRLGPSDLSLLAGAARMLAHRRIESIVCDMNSAGDSRILAQVSVLGFRHTRRVGSHHFFDAI